MIPEGGCILIDADRVKVLRVFDSVNKCELSKYVKYIDNLSCIGFYDWLYCGDKCVGVNINVFDGFERISMKYGKNIRFIWNNKCDQDLRSGGEQDFGLCGFFKSEDDLSNILVVEAGKDINVIV